MLTKPAYAKINLTLDITSKRADGYHTLETVMQSVSLCDIIHAGIRRSPSTKKTPATGRQVCFLRGRAFWAE